MLTKKQGAALLGIARNSLKCAFDGKPYPSEKSKDFNGKTGAFVTLYHGKELRGCIGFIKSDLPLWKSVSEAARLSAFEDLRFPPLRKEELKDLSFEISVLSKPELIKAGEDIVKSVKVGKDGLIMEHSGHSGLLLPQVANDYGWDSEEFLEQTCVKAGLSRGAWKERGAKIYRFQAQVFSEK